MFYRNNLTHSFISAVDGLGYEFEAFIFEHVKSRVMKEEQRIGMRRAAATVKAEAATLLSQETNVHPSRPHGTYSKTLRHIEEQC